MGGIELIYLTVLAKLGNRETVDSLSESELFSLFYMIREGGL